MVFLLSYMHMYCISSYNARRSHFIRPLANAGFIQGQFSFESDISQVAGICAGLIRRRGLYEEIRI